MADPRIAGLLERGLRHFALGDREQAASCWKQVLELDPANERARDYLTLVTDTDEPLGPGAHEGWAAGDEVEMTYLPPLPEGGLPWREWQSEAALTGELTWLTDESAGPGERSRGPGRGRAAAGATAVESELRVWAETTPLPFGREPLSPSPWSAGPPPRQEEERPKVPETTPGSTGWNPDASAVLRIDPEESGGDALSMLVDSDAPPVVVPPEVARQKTPGPDPRSEADTLMQGARELFQLGDFSGSLELVQKALALQPHHADALEYLERNQDTLVQMYESKLGSLEARPRVLLRPDEIVWLNLDHRAGFVLAQIDGTVTVDDIYALSGLSRLDTAKILAELVEQGVIAT